MRQQFRVLMVINADAGHNRPIATARVRLDMATALRGLGDEYESIKIVDCDEIKASKPWAFMPEDQYAVLGELARKDGQRSIDGISKKVGGNCDVVKVLYDLHVAGLVSPKGTATKDRWLLSHDGAAAYYDEANERARAAVRPGKVADKG
jgi:hypothetical protein